jgi:hypothetical protein
VAIGAFVQRPAARWRPTTNFGTAMMGLFPPMTPGDPTVFE